MNEISQENQERAVELANKETRCNELLEKMYVFYVSNAANAFLIISHNIFFFSRELSQLCNRQSQELKIVQSEIEKVNRTLSKKESELAAKNYQEKCFLNEV